MFKIMLIDSMNYLRQRVETERPTMLVRGVVNETLMPGVMRVFVWDGPGGNAQRRAFYPAYKAKRAPSRTDIYKSLALLRQILSHTSAWQCLHPDFEGDDMIAALVKMYPTERIQIVSTDRDFLALTDGIRVTSTATPHPKVSIPIHFTKLYKLTVGDKSDCIGGIPGFGDMAWAQADKLTLARVLDKIQCGETPFEAELRAAFLGKTSRTWLARPEAAADLANIRRVIAPLPVSPEQMESALSKGTDNPEARERLMQEFFL